MSTDKTNPKWRIIDLIHLLYGIRYNKLLKIESLEVKKVHHILSENGWSYQYRMPENYELIFVKKGNLLINIDNELVLLKAGDIYIIPKFKKHNCVHHEKNSSCDFYIVAFSISLALISDMTGKIFDAEPILPYLNELMNSLCLSCSDFYYDECMKHAIFLTILDFVHKLNSQGNEFSLDVSKILNFIDNNITTQLSLDTIAAEFSYNKDYILREFKKKYGITISKYINNKKIALAKTYLTMSDMSISKIANSVGFPTSLLFEKFFKYHVKISPSKYRKMFK